MKDLFLVFCGFIFGFSTIYIGGPSTLQWLDDHFGLPMHEAIIQMVNR